MWPIGHRLDMHVTPWVTSEVTAVVFYVTKGPEPSHLFESESHTEPRAHWLANKPRDLLVSSSPVLGSQACASTPNFHTDAGDLDSVLMLLQQALHQLNSLPCPVYHGQGYKDVWVRIQPGSDVDGAGQMRCLNSLSIQVPWRVRNMEKTEGGGGRESECCSGNKPNMRA